MSPTRNPLTDGAGRLSVLVVLALAAVIAVLLLGGLLLADTTLGDSRIDLPLIHQRASDEGGDDSSGAHDEPDENEVSDSGRGSGESEPAEGESDEQEPAENESGGREP
jgi:hypothetical protein